MVPAGTKVPIPPLALATMSSTARPGPRGEQALGAGSEEKGNQDLCL